MTNPPNKRRVLLVAAGTYLAICGVLSCASQGLGDAEQQRWWSGLGPVLPHESFPGDCAMCHEGGSWNTLVADFTFDHERKTGVPLEGAHARAGCLRCHNDRGPVDVFASRGCAGCHADVHSSDLGDRCEECHDQLTWRPRGQVERHQRTRFPLVGVHAVTACFRCHPGAEVGEFRPTDVECLTCHQDDLARTSNHVGLGWVDRCDRCHVPLAWELAEIDE
jgi:hypothetical protein